MLKTCKRTEMPPNPSKNAHNIIFTERALYGIVAICFTPLVSSINPFIIPEEKLSLILKLFNMGFKKLANPDIM